NTRAVEKHEIAESVELAKTERGFIELFRYVDILYLQCNLSDCVQAEFHWHCPLLLIFDMTQRVTERLSACLPDLANFPVRRRRTVRLPEQVVRLPSRNSHRRIIRLANFSCSTVHRYENCFSRWNRC